MNKELKELKKIVVETIESKWGHTPNDKKVKEVVGHLIRLYINQEPHIKDGIDELWTNEVNNLHYDLYD